MALYDPRQRRIRYYESTGIFDSILELVQQGYTQTEIAQMLNEKGYRTMKGRPLHQTTISNIVADGQGVGRLPVKFHL